MSAAMSFFVAGTDTEIGKTFVSAALLRGFARAGLRAAGMKPVAAGAFERDGVWHNDDADQLDAVASVLLPPELRTPYLLKEAAAPHIAAALEGVTLDLDRIVACFRQVRERADVVVVEGVGGFRVPLDATRDTADLAVALGLPVVLVVGMRLGCISHALLTAEAIAARGLTIAGWVANRIDPAMTFPEENIAALRERLAAQAGAPLLGVVPHLRGASADDAATHLDIDALMHPATTLSRRTHDIMTQTLLANAADTEPKQPGAARWRVADIVALYDLPFNDLMFRAQQVHREHFDANAMQLSTLLSIKTGGCEEDCAYCPQSSHHDTGVDASKLMEVEAVLKAASAAKANGATRFCMGAAWRNPKDRHIEPIKAMIRGVKEMGLETCMTLGMLDTQQANELADAGLDYYNHNLDTSPEFYGQIISTRTYQDRLDTLERVRDAGINVCCGGIVGMGESRRERAGLIAQLANLEPYPDSVPINNLVQVHGTPLEGTDALDPFEFVRTIAVARITMPKAMVRLSAGREQMDDALQALCFMAGANSIFYGDHLLTTSNPQAEADRKLLARLGIRTEAAEQLPAPEAAQHSCCGQCG